MLRENALIFGVDRLPVGVAQVLWLRAGAGVGIESGEPAAEEARERLRAFQMQEMPGAVPRDHL